MKQFFLPYPRRNSDEDRLISRFQELGDDGEESSKPLLDSEDQRTDEEENSCGRRARTIDRIHEREAYLDSMVGDAQLTRVEDVSRLNVVILLWCFFK